MLGPKKGPHFRELPAYKHHWILHRHLDGDSNSVSYNMGAFMVRVRLWGSHASIGFRV